MGILPCNLVGFWIFDNFKVVCDLKILNRYLKGRHKFSHDNITKFVDFDLGSWIKESFLDVDDDQILISLEDS